MQRISEDTQTDPNSLLHHILIYKMKYSINNLHFFLVLLRTLDVMPPYLKLWRP